MSHVHTVLERLRVTDLDMHLHDRSEHAVIVSFRTVHCSIAGDQRLVTCAGIFIILQHQTQVTLHNAPIERLRVRARGRQFLVDIQHEINASFRMIHCGASGAQRLPIYADVSSSLQHPQQFTVPCTSAGRPQAIALATQLLTNMGKECIISFQIIRAGVIGDRRPTLATSCSTPICMLHTPCRHLACATGNCPHVHRALRGLSSNTPWSPSCRTNATGVSEALLVPQGAWRVVAHGGDGEALFSHGVVGLMILGLCTWHVYCTMPEVPTLCHSLVDAIASVLLIVHVYCIMPEVPTLCRSLIDAIAIVVIVVAALFTVLT